MSLLTIFKPECVDLCQRFPAFRGQNTTFCNFSAFFNNVLNGMLHFEKFDLNGNIEFSIKKAEIWLIRSI